VWTAAAFGVGIQVGTIALHGRLDALFYTVVAVGSLVLLGVAQMLAEGNRRQWQDYKVVADLAETSWGLRESGDENALIVVSRESERSAYRRGATDCMLCWPFSLRQLS
jgi:hypothetical protein